MVCCTAKLSTVYTTLLEYLPADLRDIKHSQYHDITELYTDTRGKTIEKNWVPFIHHDQILFSYYIEPHAVLHLSTQQNIRAIQSSTGQQLQQRMAVDDE